MNRLLTYAGQQPVYLGDIDFMQDASKNALAYIARALMNNGSNTLNAILQGVKVTVDTSGGSVVFSWTSGVVVINGEVLPISAGSLTGTSSTILYFHVVSVTGGARTFKDGVSRDCWDTRSATITEVSTDGIAVDSVPRLSGESTSDDAVYTGVSETEQITAVRLIKRSGLWFCDVSLSLELQDPGTNLSTTFVDMTPAHMNELALKALYLPIAVNVTRTGDGNQTIGPYLEIVPITVAFTNIMITAIKMVLSFDNVIGDLKVSGNAKLQSLIPIF